MVRWQVLGMYNKKLAEIERFIKYFRDQLAEIEGLNNIHSQLYKSLLYVTVLDTLAKSVLPKRKDNRERYVYYVKRFCKWADAEKVSLVHLVQLLKKNPDPVFEKLRKWALEKFNKLSVHGSRLMPILHDLEAEEVRKYWPKSKEHRIPIEGIGLHSLQHYNLLYTYRNSLVHEMRIPGYGVDFGDNNMPYYHLMTKLSPEQKIDSSSVELIYPSAFLHSICESSLDSLKDYYISNDLNPWDSFTFGTYWLEELN